MDPFQQPSRGLRAFRAVPMTHLPNPAERGWSLPSREEADRSGPLPASIDSFTRGSTVLSRRDGAFGTDAADAGNDNVRKWQQFGLRVATPQFATSPPPLLQQQQQHAGDQHVAPHNGRAEPLQPFRYSSRTVDVEGVNVKARVHAAAVHVSGSRSGDAKNQPKEASHRPCVTHLSTSTTTAAAMSVNAPRQNSKEPTVVELADDDDGRHDHYTPPAQRCGSHATNQSLGTLAEPHDRSPFSPVPVAPVSSCTSLSTSLGDRTAAEAAQRLQLTLAQLSEKVQQSAEEQRCGPPKRPSCGGGGKPQWGAGRRGGKSSKGGTTDAVALSDDAVEENSDPAPPDSGTATAKGGRKKGAQSRKRGRAADGGDAAAAAAAATDGPAVSKRAVARKRGGGGGGVGGDDGVANGAARAPRTLFLFSATNTGPDAVRSMAGLEGASTAAATVSVPFFYQQASTEDLFADIRRALNDPDRIQAPPLFVGISTLASDGGVGVPMVECRTNFTYSTTGSKTVKGRASSCFSTMDPLDCHHHVELVVVRWKDAVHALPAQTLGFPFLCRVLTELPGVEVITFNAQATLIALLAHCKGTLWSHCVSDVRVMAWMAQLHVVGGSSASASAAYASAAEGGSAGDADMNVLYDYDQLLLRVSGGKPPPSVLLEKAREAEYYDELSAAAAPPTSEAPAPPLTPAQRLLAQQVYYLATVYRSLYGLLGSKGLLQAFLRQEKRIALLLALMRYNGIGVALAEVHRYQKTCEAEMSRQRSLAGTLVPELGNDFNIQSHDQCRRALYEVLQLGKYLTANAPGGGEAAAGTGLTITKGGRLSTAEETLRSLAPHHEFPACLLKYRKASKLMQTYVEGMMGYAIVRSERTNTAAPAASAGRDLKTGSTSPSHLVDESSNPFVDRQLCATDEEASVTAVGGEVTLPGRGYATIHPNFLQEGTDTGRLSCVEPNLQNLPRNGGPGAPATTGDGEEGEEDLLGFRRCFVAPAGSVLLSIDYQQIELRVLAHLCGDRSLIDALASSADIHRAIAEVVFKKKPVSSEERTLAKRVVFGMLYGAGPKTLAAHMGVTVERALHVTSLLTNAFPGIDTYHRRVVEESRVNGFVRTISGRLRYLPGIQSTVMARRSYAERQAFNSVVQGSAADVMKMAMLAVARDVLQLYSSADVCLLSQIHDEMVFSVRKELLPTLIPIASSAMSHAMHLRVPLSVTVKFGPSLGDLQEWGVEHDLGLGVDA